jgi:hypothetical protein
MAVKEDALSVALVKEDALSGTTAVVTGGSRGLGREMSRGPVRSSMREDEPRRPSRRRSRSRPMRAVR